MSGLPPKHGLLVTVSSGPYPKHGNPARSTPAGENPATGTLRHGADSEPFTRTETVSVRLPYRKPRRFSVYALLHIQGAILIESVEISIYEEDEKVCDIPISTSSVLLEKQGDSHVFRPTDRQFDTIAEYLEDGKTVAVRVHYLAAEQSELKVGVIDRHCHHKLRYILAIIGLG
ncbi:MAG: hypothetical protein M3Z35_04240, partial [Nitrospirota bacterium]|nr:hypothetical protein [Nitrospirota bacterium]